MRKTPPSTAAGDVTDERKSIELLFRFFFTKEHAPSRFRQRTGHPLSVRGLGAPNVRPGPGETRKERARARRKRLFFLPPLASFCSPSRRSPRSKTRPPPLSKIKKQVFRLFFEPPTGRVFRSARESERVPSLAALCIKEFRGKKRKTMSQAAAFSALADKGEGAVATTIPTSAAAATTNGTTVTAQRTASSALAAALRGVPGLGGAPQAAG